MRALIIGSGRMAAVRAGALQGASGHELVFASRDRRRAVELAREFDGSDVALDREALAQVDAVFVTSATAFHQADMELALEAGVPVLVEKPLASSAEESAGLAAAAESAGVPVIVGFQRRFDDGFTRLKRAVDAGDVGRLYLMRSASMDHAPATPAFIAQSSGIYRDLFVHDIDMAMWLTGRPVVTVYAVGDCRILDSYAEHGDADVATVIATFDDGLTATMHGIRHDPMGQDVRWELFGSTMAVAAGLARWTPLVAVEDPGATGLDPPTTFQARFADAFRSETLSFAESVCFDTPFLGCTAAQAAFVSAVAVACETSRRLGRRVAVVAPDPASKPG